MQTVYKFYSDPGHGWLAVKTQEVYRLGLASQISGYSYSRGANLFLEEDRDAALFLDAKTKAGETAIIKASHTDRQSRIRSYSQYRGGK